MRVNPNEHVYMQATVFFALSSAIRSVLLKFKRQASCHAIPKWLLFDATFSSEEMNSRKKNQIKHMAQENNSSIGLPNLDGDDCF
jgi:hypothetical protein